MRASIRGLVAAVGLCVPFTAMAQPTVEQDLGSLTLGTPVTINTGGTLPGTVKWYKFTLDAPITYASLTYLDIFTDFGANAPNDPKIGLYNSVGALLWFNDDYGPGFDAMLTYGTGSGFFPAGTSPTVRNGRNGDLPAGVYYLAVGGYQTNYGTPGVQTNWQFTPDPSGDPGDPVDLTFDPGTAPNTGPSGGFTDLGNLSPTGSATNTSAIVPAEVKWYKVVLPAASNALATYVDIDTEGTTATSGTLATRITLYGPSGAIQTTAGLDGVQAVPAPVAPILATDLADGTNSLSQLSFGLTTPTRPAPGNGLAYNGRDGVLRAGTYYIAASGTPTAAPSGFSAVGANYNMTAPSSTLNGNLKINLNVGTAPTSPAGVGTATPAIIGVGDTSVARVTVTPGLFPTSSGITVSLNAALVDGGTVTLLDDGVAPDLTLGDNVFSGNVTAGPLATLATNNLPFTVTDAQSRTSNGTLALTVSAPTNPTGTGVATPPWSFGAASTTTDVRVTVAPGLFPTSTGLAVSLNAAAINGGTVTLLDDGVAPDLTLGDNVFSGTVTLSSAVSAGAYTLPATITDGQSRTGTANVAYTVISTTPPVCPSGDESFTFTNMNSDGPALDGANGVNNMSPTGTVGYGTLRVSGRFTPANQFSGEARIRITSPFGNIVNIRPFEANTQAGVPIDFVSADYPIPCAPAGNSGTWEVRTYEAFEDPESPDGVWDNLCVTFVDANPATTWSGDTCIIDAPLNPYTPQVPAGDGELNKIVGAITNFNTDFFDWYEIRIANPATFSASTNPLAGSLEDAALFLFTVDGFGIAHNEAISLANPQSTLPAGNALYNSLPVGNYLLGVAPYGALPAWDIDAAPAFANLIFDHNYGANAAAYTAVHGPQSVDATITPIEGYLQFVGADDAGTYVVNLTGVEYPDTGGCPAGCNPADLTQDGGTLEEPGCPDGQLSLDDILLFIDAFNDATGCPGTAPCNLADLTADGGTLEDPLPPDGQLSLDDILLFNDAYNAGCP